MPTCPLCGEQINGLHVFLGVKDTTAYAWIGGKDAPKIPPPDEKNFDTPGFYCPHCLQMITNDADEATEVLFPIPDAASASQS